MVSLPIELPRFDQICLFGGGGGGGSSGKTDYPEYMKSWHHMALSDSGVDTLTMSVTDAMNAAFGNSPYFGETAYNPDADIADMMSAKDELQTVVDLLSTDFIPTFFSDSRLTEATKAFGDDLVGQLESTVIPKFEAGMRDIGAVVSSAFPIGKAILYDSANRQVAKFSADMRGSVFYEHAIQFLGMKLQYQQRAAELAIEANRMKIVAKKEELHDRLDINAKDTLWDLEIFKYGGNLLASIAGTAVQQGASDKVTFGSVLGGGLVGAGAGALIGAKIGAIGGPMGALIGGVLGMGASLFR